MRLTEQQRAAWDATGHVTVPHIFSHAECDAAVADISAWGEAFLAGLNEQERAWYVDRGVAGAAVLRKLDNPVFHRPVLRALAQNPRLVDLVEDIIGRGVTVYFSQIFFKPPGGGGPKPVHQDNYYFGPRDPDGVVTAWVALDDATVENGCLHFADGSHREAVHPHVAPPEEPFNLQVPQEIARRFAMTPAPVAKGGVSFHHGTVFHQSADNRSAHWRRACAIHYIGNANDFASPALPYDASAAIRIS